MNIEKPLKKAATGELKYKLLDFSVFNHYNYIVKALMGRVVLDYLSENAAFGASR